VHAIAPDVHRGSRDEIRGAICWRAVPRRSRVPVLPKEIEVTTPLLRRRLFWLLVVGLPLVAAIVLLGIRG